MPKGMDGIFSFSLFFLFLWERDRGKSRSRGGAAVAGGLRVYRREKIANFCCFPEVSRGLMIIFGLFRGYG